MMKFHPNITAGNGASSDLPAENHLCGDHLPSHFHDFHSQDEKDHRGLGDLGITITLRSLGNSLPSERGLVAKCFLEIARQINETIPAGAENQSQN